jgi:hypothetical protein
MASNVTGSTKVQPAMHPEIHQVGLPSVFWGWKDLWGVTAVTLSLHNPPPPPHPGHIGGYDLFRHVSGYDNSALVRPWAYRPTQANDIPKFKYVLSFRVRVFTRFQRPQPNGYSELSPNHTSNYRLLQVHFSLSVSAMISVSSPVCFLLVFQAVSQTFLPSGKRIFTWRT